ncbi:MAG TPA: O-antigen ligase family protein [Verrucomicrobiae bacterium]|nr:O-antigen ligase family protein [Verrucomicrobiae bacterium]
MNNSPIFKALVTFALVVPMAIILGYRLSDPMSYSTFATIGIILGLMVIPFLLKWRHALLLLSWNLAVSIPFIKGQPTIGLVMSALTLGIAILERTLNREMRFINVWSVTLPLCFLAAVVLFTASLTGGFGLRSFGGDVYGGKKYVFLLASIASYFALTAWRIPPEKAKLYVGLFFLGGVFSFISDLYPFVPAPLEFVFWFFSPTQYVSTETLQTGTARYAGISATGRYLLYFLILRYGLRGIFLNGTWLRYALFFTFLTVSFLGGFRTTILSIAIICTFQFFFEGLHRTRLLPIVAMVIVLVGTLLIPFASKLPYTFQRSLAFLPLEIDVKARVDADHSSKWRLEMWEALLPQVPQYLWLGKGYSIKREDYSVMESSSFKEFDASQRGLALAHDYHSGPLSMLLPFGIWGTIAFLWFMWAAGRVLYRNFKGSDPSLRIINAFLLTLFLTRVVLFLFVYGALHQEVGNMVGLVGLSLAINHGVRQFVPAKSADVQPGFLRQRIVHPRPAFQR